jgi:hypothetical protein
MDMALAMKMQEQYTAATQLDYVHDQQGPDGDSETFFLMQVELLSTTTGHTVWGLLSITHERIKFTSSDESGNKKLATLRIKLEQLVHCRLLEQQDSWAEVAFDYLPANAGDVRLTHSLTFRLPPAPAVQLESALQPYCSGVLSNIRADLLAAEWDVQLARPQRFVAGDEMPARAATKGQVLHEADGELRYGPLGARKPKIYRVDPESGSTLMILWGFSSQTAGSTCKCWANPVNFTLSPRGFR